MKKGWEYKKLGDIANDMYRGSGIKREQVTDTGIPCVRYGEIYTTYNIAFDKCASHTNEEIISSPKYFETGDILFAITGESVEEIGKSIAYLGKEKCMCGGDIVVMKHSQYPKYLSYALSSPKAIKQKGLGKTKLKVVHTNIPSLKEISIPVPPLSEQKEIVEYLDSSFAKIDKLRENAAKNIEEAKALFQSALKDALEPKEGWEEKTLGEMVKDVKYGTSKPACADGAYTYLRMNNITSDGHLDLNDTKTISLDDKELEKCIVRKGDILFNRTNSYEHVGKTCVFTEETPMVIAGYIIRIRLKECLNPYYMNYFFNMKDTKAKLRKISVGAVHQSNINAKAVQTVVIPLPSLSEQQSIVSFLDSLNEKVNTLQQNYSRICDECDALKQAILRQVFE